MSGPSLVCAGCGDPTTLLKPVCDDCLRMAGEAVTGYCALCDISFRADSPVQAASGGVHLTKSGGYAGRCTA